MAISQRKICEKMLRGRKSLVRVNRLACPESQGFLTSDPGHLIPRTAPPLRARAHATSETMSWCAPKRGTGSALLLAAPEQQSVAVSGVLSAQAGDGGGSGSLPSEH